MVAQDFADRSRRDGDSSFERGRPSGCGAGNESAVLRFSKLPEFSGDHLSGDPSDSVVSHAGDVAVAKPADRGICLHRSGPDHFAVFDGGRRPLRLVFAARRASASRRLTGAH